MASFSLNGGTVFPEGTSVSVYLRSAWGVEGVTGAPSGSAVAGPATITSGGATFTGLTDGAEYIAYAASPNRYKRFTLPPSSTQAPIELWRSEVTTSVLTVSGSSTFADPVQAPWTTPTLTIRDKPVLVQAWCGIHPTTDTATGAAKYRIVRSDNSATIAEADAPNAPAAGPISLPPIQRVLQLAPGTSISFKVQIAGRTTGVTTFGASTDLPLVLRVQEVQD